MTKDQIQTFTFRISRANKTEMITILYDMAAQYLTDALNDLKKGKEKEFRLFVNRAKDVISELMASVNVQTELGRNFLKLYIFYKETLTKAYLDYDTAAAEHVLKMMKSLSAGYSEAAKKDLSGPVMSNTENVYTGLTYNRHMTNENFVDNGDNRGYLA